MTHAHPSIHPSIPVALVGLAGLGGSLLLPAAPAAIAFLVGVVALLVAAGLGLSAVAFRRSSGAGAGAGLVLASLGLLVTVAFVATGSIEWSSPTAVQAGDPAPRTR